MINRRIEFRLVIVRMAYWMMRSKSKPFWENFFKFKYTITGICTYYLRVYKYFCYCIVLGGAVLWQDNAYGVRVRSYRRVLNILLFYHIFNCLALNVQWSGTYTVTTVNHNVFKFDWYYYRVQIFQTRTCRFMIWSSRTYPFFFSFLSGSI